MAHFLTSEPTEALIGILGDALDLVDIGVVLLHPDMRVRLLNRRLLEMFQFPLTLLTPGLVYRDMLDYAAAAGRLTIPNEDMGAFLDGREAAVRAGPIPPTQIAFIDGQRLLFSCIVCPDGGRILTYTEISRELQREAQQAAARASAEMRFASETMEAHAASLASLAESADENSRRVEAARLELEHEVAERRALEAQLRRLATTDGLTGILNRAAFLTDGSQQMEIARQARQPLTVLMIDVDHFKSINDRFGHTGGDFALQQLVGMLRAGTRPTDLVGRLGGEEFAIVLPGASTASAEAVAERLRQRVAQTPMTFGDRVIEMTISVGLALRKKTDRTIEQVIARADVALYQAKNDGRNRVVTDRRRPAA